MWLVPQRIQKQDVKILQLCQRSLGNIAVIGQISRAAKAKTVDLGLAMDHGDGFNMRAEQIQRSMEWFRLDLCSPPYL